MKLLFATDGKSPATHARNLLIKLGDPERLEVTVLSVNGFSTSLEEGARREHHYSPEAGRAYAVEVMDATVEQLRAHGFRADGRVAEGYPPYEILGEIDRGRYELTLMGSGTATWLGQVLLGSTAVKVLHASPSSVLISHNPPVEGAAKVLYGTDGSRGADLALELLIGFVGPKRAAVEVVSVVRPNMGLGPETLPSGRRLRGAEQARSHRDAERVVTRATELLDQAGFAATGEILVGRPTEQLLKAANGVGTSLVVVGSRGLDTLDRAVLGSVSDTVARHARATLVARKRNKGG